MKMKSLALLLALGTALRVCGQENRHDSTQVVCTTDITHFWEAFDSARTTRDSLRQLFFIKTLYIDRGTPGLKAFMEARDYSAEGWVHAIRSYPKFWASVRPNTLTIAVKAPQIEASVRHFRELYPALRDAKMYFTIGCLRSGGTTTDNMVLIGAEIATGDSTTDVSEFPDHWLQGVFSHQNQGYVVPLNVHEYVHTQQTGMDHASDLLGQCVAEGGADFVAELVTGIPLKSVYITYGEAHDAELKERFKKAMFEPYMGDWLYTGARSKLGAPDLGYYMGYALCTAYYRNAADKKQAIADIITFDEQDSAGTLRFVTRSGYFGGPVDRQALKSDFERQQPWVKSLSPIQPGDTTADPSVQVMTITFSEPMTPGAYSVRRTEHGRPPKMSDLTFSSDNTVLTVKVHLEPGTTYDFLLSGLGFRSAKGYPLKDYPVSFRTRSL